MSFRYSPEQLEFLRVAYLFLQLPQLAVMFNKEFNLNKNEKQLKSVLTSRKYTCGRKPGHHKGTSLLLNDEQLLFVREKYSSLTVPELTAALNKKFNASFKPEQIKTYTTNHSVKSGRSGQFKKGHETWNKGKKGFMGANVTSFKKGNIPARHRPVGSERICTKNGYILVKIDEPDPYTPAKTRWKAKHVVVWEKENGEIPKGRLLFFIDGNPLNNNINNLIAITRAELLYLNQNGYKELPAELKPSMLSLAKLETKRFKLERNYD